MQDVFVVRFLERRRDLDRQSERVLGRQGPMSGMSLDVLHDQVVRTDVVDLADVRMVQRGDRPGLALESLADRH